MQSLESTAVRAFSTKLGGDRPVLTPGSRVRLRPRSGEDVLETALGGRVAVIEAVEQDAEGRVHLTLTLEGAARAAAGSQRPAEAHRFFFSADDVEPLAVSTASSAT